MPLPLAANGDIAALPVDVKTVPTAALPEHANGETAALPEPVKVSAPVPDAANGEHAADAVPVNVSKPDADAAKGETAALPELVERERVKSPALIIIGDVTARDDAALMTLALEAQA